MRRLVVILVSLTVAVAAPATFFIRARAERREARREITHLYRARCDLAAGTFIRGACVERVDIPASLARLPELERVLRGAEARVAMVAPLVEDVPAGRLLRARHFARRPLPPGSTLMSVEVDARGLPPGLVPGAVVALFTPGAAVRGLEVAAVERRDGHPRLALSLVVPGDRQAAIRRERPPFSVGLEAWSEDEAGDLP